MPTPETQIVLYLGSNRESLKMLALENEMSQNVL